MKENQGLCTYRVHHHLDAFDLESIMPFRIRQVLLVTTLYNYFMIEEDGRITELLSRTYSHWNLGYVPTIIRAGKRTEALERIRKGDIDLVIIIMRPSDLNPCEFTADVRGINPSLPVILLAYDVNELARFQQLDALSCVNRTFLWHGNGSVILGIIQYIEDFYNSTAGDENPGIQNLLIVEDSIEFYSLYLPVIFEELRDYTRSLLHDNLTFSQKQIRQHARPRVHLATCFEEAMEIFNCHEKRMLGIICDAVFPLDGKPNTRAGRTFIETVRARNPHLPVIFQSTDETVSDDARELNAGFIHKNSHTLRSSFRNALDDLFGFGDLRLPGSDGGPCLVASNLTTLTGVIRTIPSESLAAAVEDGSISRWLRARTNFALADSLDSIQCGQQCRGEPLRETALRLIRNFRKDILRGSIVPYSPHYHEDYSQFSYIGGGSIGGKARGLEFMDTVLHRGFDKTLSGDMSVSIPRSLFIRTDLFDEFLEFNNLTEFASTCDRDDEIASRFSRSLLPAPLLERLREFSLREKSPLAVRSSSLLEDSFYQTFSNIYSTVILPNTGTDEDRFLALTAAIQHVYASSFFSNARKYVRNTGLAPADEKMGVIIQELCGARHGNLFYPDFSGIAQSANFYPAPGAQPSDGVARVVAGLGISIAGGGFSLQFSPSHPGILPQFNTIDDMLDYSQKTFFALSLANVDNSPFFLADPSRFVVQRGIQQAEQDGVLEFLASTYSAENQALYDGISSPGPRVITFAHILKNDIVPLAPILNSLLSALSEAMGCPVEIEFAGTLTPHTARPASLHLLQVRPMALHENLVTIEKDSFSSSDILCSSNNVLGNGIVKGITDAVIVTLPELDASLTGESAAMLEKFNTMLTAENRPYLLLGPGRWGSSEPWLGIPVRWNQISGAKVILETGIEGRQPDFSRGSHFFHNISSNRIGYFTVDRQSGESFLDTEWLLSHRPVRVMAHVWHVRFDRPLTVMMDGRSGRGIILK